MKCEGYCIYWCFQIHHSSFFQVEPFVKKEMTGLRKSSGSEEIGFFKVGPLDVNEEMTMLMKSAEDVHSKCDIKPLTAHLQKGTPDESCIDPLKAAEALRSEFNPFDKRMAARRMRWSVVSLLLPGSNE